MCVAGPRPGACGSAAGFPNGNSLFPYVSAPIRAAVASVPPTREGGRELWEAYLADAQALISGEYAVR